MRGRSPSAPGRTRRPLPPDCACRGPVADYLILRCLRESGGTALTVTDDEALAAVPEIAAAEGVFACPEGAATLAALHKLLQSSGVDGTERIVLLNTGSGLKYLDVLG